ncbi:helix-turn-helix domain-containing protein [Pseudomonas sp. Pseusp88]|uniref:helix-turn-helix domain-containing protein n=1 Tax=Pseudomonas sp. Pseusp88 TaxID=3243061 RepID=UPI0039A51C6F
MCYRDRQITEIAYSLGFNSASDFTRAFRRHYGMSPQDHLFLAFGKLCGYPLTQPV